MTLKSLFQKDVRYVIPIFQRPYVWNQDDQWEPLWSDVRNTAERYLDELVQADGNKPLAEERAGTHFMGAVVLQQQPTATAEIETRYIIDGQQRLTTAQILMDAAQEVFEELNAEAESRRVSRLVLNEHVDGDERFKLWPTSLDQVSFRAAMDNDAQTEGLEESLIVQAHDFFRLQILSWIESAPTDAEQAERIHGLEAAIFGLLVVVVIDLATADDAFVIFETLNARGTPLLASDLVKNFVLQTATADGLKADQLYERDWQPLEDSWWRDEVRQGRIVRPRLDVFLNYYLVMETAKEVASHEVFPSFKLYMEGGGKVVTDVVADIRRVGETYRGFLGVDPTSREGTFLYRWETVDAGTVTPLLLWLFSQPDHVLARQQRIRAIDAIESFLIRRMICRMTTKDYNRLFLELMSRLHDSAVGTAADTVVTYLAGQSSESRRWPTDREIEVAIRDLPLFRLLTRGRLRMVLEGIEDQLRSPLVEEAHVPRRSLTIEHIMPKAWKKHWPLEYGLDGLQAELDRERLLHSLGNLTLVSFRLNPKLSNAPWTSKRATLDRHTVLRLNKELLSNYGDRNWDEVAIRDRGGALAEVVKRIWPAAPPSAS